MTGGDTAITTNVAASGPAKRCQKHLESSPYPFCPEEKLQREFCFSIPQSLFHKYTSHLVNVIPLVSALNIFLLSFNINQNAAFPRFLLPIIWPLKKTHNFIWEREEKRELTLVKYLNRILVITHNLLEINNKCVLDY